MNKIKIILILLIAAGVATYILVFSPKAEESRIKIEIIKANYCETASECKMAAVSACPFGCHIYVNENEVGRIEKILNDYRNDPNRGTRCEYSCLEIKGVECVQNSCQTVH